MKSVSLLFVVLLVAISAVALIEYIQINAFQRENNFFKEVNSEAVMYYNEFGVAPIANVNSSFSPPISMYRALQIGLEADNWNKSALQGMKVYISLMSWDTVTNSSSDNNNTEINNILATQFNMTNPPANYSDITINGVIYRYVWQIDLQKGTGITIPPWDLMIVDAATGEIIPHGPLY